MQSDQCKQIVIKALAQITEDGSDWADAQINQSLQGAQVISLGLLCSSLNCCFLNMLGFVFDIYTMHNKFSNCFVWKNPFT